jgi:hypothetical protein
MPLTIEDGTVVSGADSYHTAAELIQYIVDVKGDTSDFDPDEVDQAIRRGTQYIDLKYSSRWPGYRTEGRDQSLMWPRTYAYDRETVLIPSDEIPSEVIVACMEASYRELKNPGILIPDNTGDRLIRSEQVGPLAVTYEGGMIAPSFPEVDQALFPLLGSSAMTKTFLRA